MSGPNDDFAGAALLDEALSNPGVAAQQARSVLTDAEQDIEAQIHARFALGLALREQGRLEESRRELELALRLADDHQQTTTAARIRSSLALVLFHQGETERALQETEEAGRFLRGADAARTEAQRALILQRLGLHDEALAAYDRALPGLRRYGDVVAEARHLSNRGVLRTYAGDHRGAAADFETALTLARSAGLTLVEAMCQHNLGFVLARQGHAAQALRHLDEAQRLFELAGGEDSQVALREVDRAEILADAGLLDEAVARARRAVELQRGRGDRTERGEAELLLARLLLLSGSHDEAAAVADRVHDLFAEDGRVGWKLQALHVGLTARLRGDEDVELEEAERVADELAAGGWSNEARAARLAVARSALGAGRHDVARRLLSSAARVRSGMPALARAQHWHAVAMLRAATGDRRGARRAITTGLGVLHRSRLLFASAELRAHAASHTTGLVALAVRMALEDRRPTEALIALDLVRAADVAVSQQPPDDPQLADDLAELRRMEERQREAARTGGANLRNLTAARATLEQRIRDRTRALAHDPAEELQLPRLDIAALRRSLSGRTLAAYLQLDGRLHVLAVTPRATTHLPLGPVAEVEAEIAHVRSALRRLAYGRSSQASMAAADRSLMQSTSRLRSLLRLDALHLDGGVIVPTGVLASMPWGLLAASGGSLPTIAPSAQAWLSATRRHVSGGPALLAAGPDLPGGEEEVSRLAELYPDALVMTGDAATTGAVLAGLEKTSSAHLSAHGTFRADNALFSALRFVDGPLTVYELETLRDVPGRIVLPSCEAAATQSVRGDVVLGLTTILLRMGTGSVIAPVVEIPDAATAPLMLDLHRGLVAGLPSGRALQAAIQAARADSPQERAVRASFVAFGS